jgi:hypothetical protein
MNSTLISKPSDDPHDVVVVAPDAIRVAPSDEELSDLLHQAARHRSDIQTHVASDVPATPSGPPVDTTFRPAAVNDALVGGERWSVVGQAMRAFMALLLAACIGLAAFAWRAYGDTAERKIAKWVTQFALTASPPPEKPAPVAQQAAPAVHGVDAANAAPPQPAAPAPSAAENVAPAVAAPSSGSFQLLQTMARDLASLGQEVEQLKASVEQLKAGQQQMSRDVAKASEVKAPEQIVRPRISALPPRPATQRVRKPMAPSPPPQAAAVVPLPQAPAPYVPRQIETQRQPTAETLADPELSSVPRPPMPVR